MDAEEHSLQVKQRQRNKEIEEQLGKDKKRMAKEVKLLLLGEFASDLVHFSPPTLIPFSFFSI